MGEHAPVIKCEPHASARPAEPQASVPVASATAACVTKRDHLRALLDRARAKTQTRRDPPAVDVKPEPVVVPVAEAPAPQAAPAIPAEGGLLPTPSTRPTRVVAPTLPPSTAPRTDASHYLHHHYGLGHSYEPPVSFGSDSARPLPTVVPTYTYGEPPNVYAYPYAPESAPQRHYQAHPPPSVAIPAHPPYPTVDSVAIDKALAAHTASVSPSMSATTSSSSSSNTKRKREPESPGSTRVRSTKSSNQAKKPEGRTPEERVAVPKLSPAEIASLDEYEDNELHSDFVHTVHMLIPAGSFGCLVGHRGEFMKEINAASECTLSVRDASSFPMFESDRVLRIYGKPKGICVAQQIVIARLRNYGAHKGDSSYVDLGEKPMAPMAKNSVTRTMNESIKDESGVDDADAVASQGELRWLVHKDSVGRIMGRQGIILKAIARDTNTTIHVVPIQSMAPGSTERTVIITGQPAHINSARAIIEAKAGGRLETDGAGPGKAGQYFVIPQHVAGFLIGPNGTRIRKIRDATGARIQVPAQHDLPLGYVNRMLHIQGNNEEMEAAQAGIMRRLESYVGSPESIEAAKEDDIALQLVLPTRICSFLLDQRGRLIREISEKAGAHARFLPPIGDDHRICVLYGDMPKVFRAERLVLQFVAGDAIANKWAHAGGAPPRERKRGNERGDEEGDDVNVDAFSEELDDSDDDFRRSDSRGRGRKRQHIGDWGRIVVHYSAPSRHSSSPSTNRRASNGRKSTQTKVHSRSKRRRKESIFA